jgi:DNA mismatch repair ATPase MutL
MLLCIGMLGVSSNMNSLHHSCKNSSKNLNSTTQEQQQQQPQKQPIMSTPSSSTTQKQPIEKRANKRKTAQSSSHTTITTTAGTAVGEYQVEAKRKRIEYNGNNNHKDDQNVLLQNSLSLDGADDDDEFIEDQLSYGYIDENMIAEFDALERQMVDKDFYNGMLSLFNAKE